MIICHSIFLRNFIDRIKAMSVSNLYSADGRLMFVSKQVRDQLLYALGRSAAIAELAKRRNKKTPLQKRKKPVSAKTIA